MKLFVFVFILSVLFIQCQSKESQIDESNQVNEISITINKPKKKAAQPSRQDTIDKNYNDTFALLFNTIETGYLPIYKFSDSIMGMRFDGYEFDTGTIYEGFQYIKSEESGIKIWYEDTKLKYKGATFVEETPFDVLFENQRLTYQLLYDNQKTYSIICTKGNVRRRFHKAYFAQNDCHSNFIYLAIEPIDTAYGEPLWAVLTSNYDIQSVKNKKLEQFCEVVFDFQSRYSDFYDTPSNNNSYQILGKHEDYYLVYRDDFKWKNNTEGSMLFPSRMLIKKEGNAFKVKSNHSLDLFGIPCL